jgi:methionyl-tRNA formyltransferase
MKIAVIGGVGSTEVLVQALVKHGFEQVKVWGYQPTKTALVSGWRDLRQLAGSLKLPFESFVKVTDCEDSLRSFAPDFFFVVGLSQIVPASMLNIASRGNIGFHPTALPFGRGRAALAWLILERQDGAATFFELVNGVDEGPIFEQEVFTVSETDDTSDVEAKLLCAEEVALDHWLPVLKKGELIATEQDHENATWFGRRAPEDGWLNWLANCDDLLNLIRASAPPHPGAFTYCRNSKVEIHRASRSRRPETGVPGRILKVYPKGIFDVQAGDGILHVTEWKTDGDWLPRVGVRLGYYDETEIFDLRIRLAKLEQTVECLNAKIIKMGISESLD